MTINKAIPTIHNCMLDGERYAQYEDFNHALQSAVSEALKPCDPKGRTVCAAYIQAMYDYNYVGANAAVHAYWQQHACPEPPEPEWPHGSITIRYPVGDNRAAVVRRKEYESQPDLLRRVAEELRNVFQYRMEVPSIGDAPPPEPPKPEWQRLRCDGHTYTLPYGGRVSVTEENGEARFRVKTAGTEREWRVQPTKRDASCIVLEQRTTSDTDH